MREVKKRTPDRFIFRGECLSRSRKIFNKNYQLFLLMLPAVATTFLFDYVTMYGVQIAFKDYRALQGIWGSAWVGFKHFERFIGFSKFWTLIKNTLTITLYSLATFPIGVILSLFINEMRSLKYKKVVQMTSYAPHFLSVVVIVSMIQLLLGRANGLVNNVIYLLGGKRIDFLSIPEYFPSIYVWSGVWQNAGWNTIIYIAALAGVSQELVEAAKIDGASRLRIIWHINIPAILPTVIILFILSTGGLLSLGYEKIILMQNPLNRPASDVISTYVFDIGISGREYSYSTAINLFNNVINIIIIVCVNKIANRLSGVGLW